MTKITARAAIQNLGEHFLAFMAVNNLSGFLHNEDAVIDDTTVGGTLLLIAMEPQHTGAQLKERAAHLMALSQGVITQTRARVLVQMAIGVRFSRCRNRFPNTEVFVTDWERGLKNTQVYRAKHDGEGIRSQTRAAAVGLCLLRKLSLAEKQAIKLVAFPDSTSIDELLLCVHAERYLHQDTLKRVVHQMRVVEGKQLKVHECYRQIANTLGYPEYPHMRMLMHHDVIANLNHPDNIQSLITEMVDEEE
jgi:hypothetical protein